MENKSITTGNGRSIIGSLPNNNPHFIRAFESMKLACFENDNCDEKLKPKYMKSFTLSIVLFSSSNVQVGRCPRWNTCTLVFDVFTSI